MTVCNQPALRRAPRIEAACKLSQNRDVDERRAIATVLEQSEASDDRAIAALLRRLDDPPSA